MEETEEGQITFDFIKDDPCYGCKFAIKIPDKLLMNPWNRRLGCKNMERRDAAVRSAKIFLERDSSMSVEEAKRNLDAAVEMDASYKKNGFIDCEFPTIGHPNCYMKHWNDVILDAVEEIDRLCDVKAREQIGRIRAEFFDLPLDILRVLRHGVEEESSSPKPGHPRCEICGPRDELDAPEAVKRLKRVYEISKAVFDDLDERRRAGVELGFYNGWRELANKIMKLVPKTIFTDEAGEKVELKFKYKVMRQKFGEKWNTGENEGKSICIYQTNVYSDAEKFIVDDIADMKAKWPELGEMRAGGLNGCKWWNMGDIEFGVEYQISTDDGED